MIVLYLIVYLDLYIYTYIKKEKDKKKWNKKQELSPGYGGRFLKWKVADFSTFTHRYNTPF